MFVASPSAAWGKPVLPLKAVHVSAAAAAKGRGARPTAVGFNFFGGNGWGDSWLTC